MAEPFALLDRLQDAGFTASVCTTYNAYLPFYEQVVLRRLRAAGCQLNIVLMDSAQFSACMEAESLRPRLAGIDYVLVPVEAGGLFHPKILLRLGKRKGALFIGSHNLTFAGFAHNHEFTSVFTHDGGAKRESVVHFQAVRDELRRYVSSALPNAKEALEASFAMAPWLAGPAPVDADTVIVGSHADGSSLWDRARSLVRGRPRRALIVGPFFDSQLAFVERVRRDLAPELGVSVAIDPATATLAVDATATCAATFVNVRDRLPRDRRRDGDAAYLHAKLIWIETDQGELLIAGSANPGRSAFLSELGLRNAETVVARWSSGTRDALLREARIEGFLDAPEVTGSEWTDMARRLASDGDEGPTDGIRALMAETTEQGFVVNGLVDSDVDVFDERDAYVGQARFASSEAGRTSLATSPEVRDAAAMLRSPGCRILVHHTDRIGELLASDTRRALRNALGRLDEDPTQLEALLRLTEKVIFDAAEVAAASGERNRSRTVSPEANEVSSPTSLALDATGRRPVAARRRGIATGDLAALLDALIRRLGEGLAAGTPRSEERDDEESEEPTEEEPRSGEPPAEPPTEPDLRQLAALCRRKVKTMVRRVVGQLELASEPSATDATRRAVVQLAAVLSLLHALRIYERRPEWRHIRERLLDDRALSTLFEQSVALLVVPESGILDRAVAANEGDAFDEHQRAVGLLVWLAWEVGVDLDTARRGRRSTEVDDEPWAPLQRLLFLGRWCDAQASAYASEAVRGTPRRGYDHEGWLRLHLEWVGAAADDRGVSAVDVGSALRPGDLVLVSERFPPRLRVVLSMEAGTRGHLVLVLQPSGEPLKLLANRVVPVDVSRRHSGRKAYSPVN